MVPSLQGTCAWEPRVPLFHYEMLNQNEEPARTMFFCQNAKESLSDAGRASMNELSRIWIVPVPSPKSTPAPLRLPYSLVCLVHTPSAG